MNTQNSLPRETRAAAWIEWLTVLAVLLFLSVPRPTAAASDPCDFTSAFSFERDQVLECYRSVPFCPDPNDPVSCDRDAQVTHLRAAIEGFADLRETYDATVHWRRKLEAVEKADFASDYDFFLAMADVMAEFRSGHWLYYGSACYEETLFGVIPLEFGSMIDRQRGVDRQIIYLAEPRPYFASVYLQATGIDVTPHIGKRVVQINGVDPLVFFREWGRTSSKSDSDDGVTLMGVLERGLYSFRVGSFDPFPESRSVRLDLETRDGARTRLELPWAFIPSTEFGLPGPMPASSEAFRESCFAPAVPTTARAKTAPVGSALRQPKAADERQIKREKWMAGLKARRPAAQVSPNMAAGGFEEVPRQKQFRDISVIVPFADNSVALEYTKDTTAIRLFDFQSEWFDELDAGAKYACEHSDRLIIDLRSNQGGHVLNGQLLAHFLNPTAPVVPDTVFGFRKLAASPALNELRDLSEQFTSTQSESCLIYYESGCHAHMPSGQLVSPSEWLGSSPERRGNTTESLSPLVTLSFYYPRPEEPVIACPGKFKGKNLIFLVNGANGSMGFFTPALLKGLGTVVVAGGYAGEPMQMGKTRGGAVFPSSVFQDDADLLERLLDVKVQHRLPDLPRPVAFYFEIKGFYKPDLNKLYADEPTFGDIRVPFWSNSPATDGAAYRMVVSAVEQRATIDPVCGTFRELRQCAKYAACAKRTLDEAVRQDRISEEAAVRTLEDAVASCR